MYKEIKSDADIEAFLDQTNGLHDGYVIGVRYENTGIEKIVGGHRFYPEKTKLILQILVTSIWDAVAELEFEDILEWQIRVGSWDITETRVTYDEKKGILWADEDFTTEEEAKEGSYVKAKSMRWRILPSDRG